MNKGLVSMLHEVVNERSLFALTFVPAILSGVGEHGMHSDKFSV